MREIEGNQLRIAMHYIAAQSCLDLFPTYFFFFLYFDSGKLIHDSARLAENKNKKMESHKTSNHFQLVSNMPLSQHGFQYWQVPKKQVRDSVSILNVIHPSQ